MSTEINSNLEDELPTAKVSLDGAIDGEVLETYCN